MRTPSLRSPRAVLVAVAATIALAVSASGARPATAAAPLPVPWDVVSFVGGGATPDTVPGANDWRCRPTAEHPRPVVLVHGLLATLGDNWRTMAPLLSNNGFCVFGLTYGRLPGLPFFGGLTRMEPSAAELQQFVDRVLRVTGAKQVDLVGHSEGTVMPRWYLSFLGGAPKVHRYVQLTPLWNGTNLLGLADLLQVGKQLSPAIEPLVSTLLGPLCGSCAQFLRGSAYLDAVNRAGPAVPGIQYTAIATRNDELVQPYTSGLIQAPNVKNVVLQDVCPNDQAEHLAVAFDPNVGQLILNALDPARARKVPCVPMLITGPVGPVPEIGLAPAAPKAPAAPRTCARGRAIELLLRRHRGERIRRVVVTSGRRRVARSGRALRSVRLTRLAPGRRTLRIRTVSRRQDGRAVRRSYRVRRTVRCAA